MKRRILPVAPGMGAAIERVQNRPLVMRDDHVPQTVNRDERRRLARALARRKP